jgi:ACR3 family arsenite transporter
MVEKKEGLTKERNLGIWEKYLTFWVTLCIVIGIALGRVFPFFSYFLGKLEIAHISIPVAICLFTMIYPIMVQIDFTQIIEAGKTPKPIAATLIMNWMIKPFTMAFFAWLFLGVIFASFLKPDFALQYRAGLILLGVAPCTAMVLMWSYLANGNMGHTIVMTAINSLSMVILYAPLACILLGISGVSMPWRTIVFSVGFYICTPLVFGYITRSQVIKRRGVAWFEKKLIPLLEATAIISLLLTLIILFILQGHLIVELPFFILLIAIPIFINIITVFVSAYLLSKIINLSYEDAAPTAIIAGSNHFEVAIAVSTTLFGVRSGASLATVVGVLTEVPMMLFLVWLCKKTKHFFPRGKDI